MRGGPLGGVTVHTPSTINRLIAKRDLISQCTTASAERRAGKKLAGYNNVHVVDIVKISSQASFVDVRGPTSAGQRIIRFVNC